MVLGDGEEITVGGPQRRRILDLVLWSKSSSIFLLIERFWKPAARLWSTGWVGLVGLDIKGSGSCMGTRLDWVTICGSQADGEGLCLFFRGDVGLSGMGGWWANVGLMGYVGSGFG